MAHEKSISVGLAPKVFLVPTVVNGRDIGAAAAQRLFEAGKLKPLAGPFKSIGEADRASKRRSKATPENLRTTLERAFKEGR